MVTRDPIWNLRKFSATIINDVWDEVFVFTLIATVVVMVSEKTSVNLGVSNQLLTVLGLVLALVISFRTSSAYERYQDGRKMWTNVSIASRNMAQMIWIHVPNERPKQSVLENIIEKKAMINLIHAYTVSVKHFLRGEGDIYYEDLYPSIAFLPKYATSAAGTKGDYADRLPLWYIRDEFNRLVDRAPTSQDTTNGASGESAGGSYRSEKKQLSQDSQLRPLPPFTSDPEGLTPIISDHPLKPAQNPPPITIFDFIPVLGFIRWIIRKLLRRARPDGKRRRGGRKYEVGVESHIPLEISLILSNYSAWLMKSKLVEPAIATGITNNLASLQDTVVNLERICNTPLPLAYQVHLRMSLWLYLFFLPFQIYLAYGYITIPATAFTSFMLLGFLEIGQQIENPFNYDANDLDLDLFCRLIRKDLHQITAFPCSDPSTFIFDKCNQPFAPADCRSAEELKRSFVDEPYCSVDGEAKPGMTSIRRTLVKGWKTVDELTRMKCQ